MRQALHIFRKDLRHLWPQTALVLLLAASYAVLAARSGGRPFEFEFYRLRQLAEMLGVLVPAAYAWLIVTLVHQEALPGDRQFWLTRPTRVGSLVAAKALFVLLFVSASMVAKDCYIVAAHGFPILPGVTGLALRLMAWTAWVVLPALAAGVITRNLQEVGLVGAGIGVLYALEGILARRTDWPGVEWVRDDLGMLVLLAGCGAIVLWQYFRRWTIPARAAAACCSMVVILGLPWMPWSAAFAVQRLARRPRPDLANAQVLPGVMRAHAPVPESEVTREAFAYVALPVRLTGVPGGMEVVPDAVKVEIASSSRVLWRSAWWQNWYVAKAEKYTSQSFYLDRDTYRQLENQRVTVRLSLGLTILEDLPPTSVPAHARTFAFEGAQCEQRSLGSFPPEICCVAALRQMSQTRVAVSAPGASEYVCNIGTRSHAAYPALLDMDPTIVIGLPIDVAPNSLHRLRSVWEQPDARLILTPTLPVAHIRRDLEFSGIRLADYALPAPRTEMRVFSNTIALDPAAVR